MDLTLTRFEGDTLHAVHDLIGRGQPLIIVANRSAWEKVSEGADPEEVSRTVITRPTGNFSVVRADLNFVRAEPESLARSIGNLDADAVALRKPENWADADLSALVELLLRHGRPVVFFVGRTARLGVLATLTPPAVLISPLSQNVVLVGTLSGSPLALPQPVEWLEQELADDPPPLAVEHVDDPQGLSIEHIFDLYAGRLVARNVDLPIVLDWWTSYGSGEGSGYPVGRVPEHSAEPPEFDGKPPQPAVRQPEARSVNALIVRPGTEVPVPADEPMEPAGDYELLVNIAAYRTASLLAETDSRWPSEPLPSGDLVLRALLSMDGEAEPQIARFTLPSDRASFACACPDDGHTRDCVPRRWVRFSLTAPAKPVVWTGELVVYYGVVAVHAQRLFLPVGTAATDGMHSRLVYRLTRTFADLGSLAERTVSVLVTDRSSRTLVNGVTFARNPAWISANAADNAVRAARQLLYDLHLSDGRSTLDGNYGKSAAEFTADLAALACQGAVLFERLFRDNDVFDTLPELIRHEAVARNRPAVLNVADPTISDPDRRHPVPWSLIYDLPMPQDPRGAYEICPSVRRFGPGGTEETIPPHCPEGDHTGNVLCPFGFWGLSAIIEQPASTDSLVWHVFDDAKPMQVEVAADPRLDPELSARHLAALETALPRGTVHLSTIESAQQLADALALETMDVAYLYCHGGYHKVATNALPSPVLRFGASVLDPVTVANWRRDGRWPRPHWPSRKPLIVLNGCHTAELTTATLSNFVDAFANRAGAAGVIGTEITIEQGMAGWAMEELLRSLVDGAGVGQALRALRWRMINRGNVMGLAYTLYCVAGLRLRPQGLTLKEPT
ncbi:hypothetical protein [Amycolatopsis sp. NPDC021455]|uniref:hypothetical protein n=1 Tax=Amycolatopsis sp. NPDC021455 TaxID=3154901 RepID=UPI0033C58D7D